MDIAWCQGESLDFACPVCGQAGAKRALLRVAHALSGAPLSLLVCSACECAFYDDLRPFDYHSPVTPEPLARMYLEQGAGVISMVQPALRCLDMPVERYAEIGCGYGFGLDFARYVFDCSVLGFDPSNMAERGRQALNIDIRTDYVTAENPLQPPVDLLVASEVVEHIPEPHAFLHALAKSISPGGVLALTTPNGQGIKPNANLAILTLVLSPGHHLILFSQKGLEMALKRAGFAHVQVQAHEYSLVAYASREPLPPPPADPIRGQTALMHYHLDKAHRAAFASSLQIGHLGRLLPLALSLRLDYVFKTALDDLQAAVKQAHGFDLADMQAIEARLSVDGGLSDVSKRLPLNLTPVLYLLARIRRQAGLLQAAIPVFDLARRVGTTIRSALQQADTDDGDTDHYLRLALFEELDCRLCADKGSFLPRLDEVLRWSSEPNAALMGCSPQSTYDLVRKLAQRALTLGDEELANALIGRMPSAT